MSQKLKKIDLNICQEPFLTLKDVPDSWDGDQQPRVIKVWCTQPYKHSSLSHKLKKQAGHLSGTLPDNVFNPSLFKSQCQ